MSQATLSIDLSAIVANWAALDRLSAPGCVTSAVVKADAYGLGAARVGPALAQAGVSWFFVALAHEGVALRRAIGPKPVIAVLSGHMAGDAPLLAEADLTPMLNSPEQVTRHFSSLPKHSFGVQLDSGMHRLGLASDDWRAVAPTALAHSPRLIMSHLACADQPDHPMNPHQLSQFRAMSDGLGVPRALAATGGILLGRDYHFDLTRPGIGLYGGAPFTAASPVVALSLPVIQTRWVEPGCSVGYANAWIAPRRSRIATVGAGYADGLIRALGAGGAHVFCGAQPCPIVGRASMDLITVDLTDLPHAKQIPEVLDILSPHQGVDALADKAGTIGYEILTSLGTRYGRNYHEGQTCS